MRLGKGLASPGQLSVELAGGQATGEKGGERALLGAAQLPRDPIGLGDGH